MKNLLVKGISKKVCFLFLFSGILGLDATSDTDDSYYTNIYFQVRHTYADPEIGSDDNRHYNYLMESFILDDLGDRTLILEIQTARYSKLYGEVLIDRRYYYWSLPI